MWTYLSEIHEDLFPVQRLDMVQREGKDQMMFSKAKRDRSQKDLQGSTEASGTRARCRDLFIAKIPTAW